MTVSSIPGLSRSSSVQDDNSEAKDGMPRSQSVEQNGIAADSSTHPDLEIPSYQEVAHPNPKSVLYPNLS